jgi:hypothetical protein
MIKPGSEILGYPGNEPHQQISPAALRISCNFLSLYLIKLKNQQNEKTQTVNHYLIFDFLFLRM